VTDPYTSPVSSTDLPAWLEPIRLGAESIQGEDLSMFLPPEGAETRQAAVLLLFGEGPDGPDILLTERAHDMRSHPGQVSFPGGSIDPGETAEMAALREGEEETGLDAGGVEVVGALPTLWLPPSNFSVTPVLAYWRTESAVHVVDPREVHAIYRVPISHLTDPANRIGVRHPIGWVGPGFLIGEDNDVILWGFTAGVISRLFDYIGWEQPWDESRVMTLPDYMLDWNRTDFVAATELEDRDLA
jgi:8-oxo-dGTP pyrophosphatase MutT (NUDIX family)